MKFMLKAICCSIFVLVFAACQKLTLVEDVKQTSSGGIILTEQYNPAAQNAFAMWTFQTGYFDHENENIHPTLFEELVATRLNSEKWDTIEKLYISSEPRKFQILAKIRKGGNLDSDLIRLNDTIQTYHVDQNELAEIQKNLSNYLFEGPKSNELVSKKAVSIAGNYLSIPSGTSNMLADGILDCLTTNSENSELRSPSYINTRLSNVSANTYNHAINQTLPRSKQNIAIYGNYSLSPDAISKLGIISKSNDDSERLWNSPNLSLPLETKRVQFSVSGDKNKIGVAFPIPKHTTKEQFLHKYILDEFFEALNAENKSNWRRHDISKFHDGMLTIQTVLPNSISINAEIEKSLQELDDAIDSLYISGNSIEFSSILNSDQKQILGIDALSFDNRGNFKSNIDYLENIIFFAEFSPKLGDMPERITSEEFNQYVDLFLGKTKRVVCISTYN